MTTPLPKIAVVGPNFFSYIQAVRDELSRRNIYSEYFDERHSNTVFAKIAYRLGFSFLTKRSSEYYLDSLIDEIIKNSFTDVLFFSIEIINEAFLEKLANNGIKLHVYMWDSAKNKPSFLSLMPYFNSASSFEPDDCVKYSLKYIPLFAEEIFCDYRKKHNLKTQDISYCGTLHSDRGGKLFSLRGFCEKNNVSLKEYLFFHSRLLFFVYSLIRPVNFFSLFKISTKGYSKDEVAKLFSSSKFVFDIQHNGQKGLTARTFEALRAGSLLITFNPTAHDLPDALRSRVLVIDEISDLNTIDLHSFESIELDSESDYFLSIERFTDQLLGEILA